MLKKIIARHNPPGCFKDSFYKNLQNDLMHTGPGQIQGKVKMLNSKFCRDEVSRREQFEDIKNTEIKKARDYLTNKWGREFPLDVLTFLLHEKDKIAQLDDIAKKIAKLKEEPEKNIILLSKYCNDYIYFSKPKKEKNTKKDK